MLKKLDKLIIKAFIGPFVATFFITLLVLVMQFFWLYIDDFVGKGLGAGVIAEFIWYQSAVLVPLALPLAVLLSSLMTFGNLGETYELVAIKSAGISLLRFMRPLFFVTLTICFIAFLFSNYIIPVANLKSRTLLADIVYAKPSFDIKEGVFYDKISGFAIKIGKKEPNDSVIRDIIIYEQAGASLQDNFIIAEDGVMRISDNKRYLEFILKNGWRYQERGNTTQANTEFVRLGFDQYTKQFDLSSFQFQRTSDSVNKNNQRMLSMRQLGVAIDSIRKDANNFAPQVRRDVLSSAEFRAHLDSNWAVAGKVPAVKSFSEILPDSMQQMVRQRSQGIVQALKSNGELVVTQYNDRQRDLRKYQIEWHRKISLSLACLVLFLIGAPLGSIIRKGGLGSPMVFSIIFFMVFYFLGTSGEKLSRAGSLHPFNGMWLSSYVLVPIGLFLTVKAVNDSQLFNREFYQRAWSRFKARRAAKTAKPA
ncbi:LptF/LptG family permease [Pseudocnuella soli]|uniref:LptF/LptG family permease n=1 Tax=Pseudocnuella soli TaxID=2502779 RepID=UPI001F023548|nr:LptF/LptG family permease [Pseudocnuella soli]